MRYQIIKKSIVFSIISILILSSLSMISIGEFNTGDNTTSENISETPYEGHLRIYVVEPESRWNMYDGNPYHYGFLDYAFNNKLSINYLDTYEDTVYWNGDVTEDNIMVIAAIFSPISQTGYAYPPAGKPFDAYYVDAATGALTGETGINTVNEDFTHTIFLEEGTATWCQYCPNMANALESIYQSGDYPFYFVALIDDKNTDASDRIREDYNIFGFPTAFFDGGRRVLVGGESDEGPYRSRIETLATLDVHELNLTISVSWLGSGEISIEISITNLEEIHYPAKPSTPDGPTSGKIREEYTYCTSTTDPDGNDVYYWFDWGDGTNSGWIGPYPSGETVCINNSWNRRGSYQVRVKAKDTEGNEGGWSYPLAVSIPRIRQINSILMRFFEYFQNTFPIICKILGFY